MIKRTTSGSFILSVRQTPIWRLNKPMRLVVVPVLGASLVAVAALMLTRPAERRSQPTAPAAVLARNIAGIDKASFLSSRPGPATQATDPAVASDLEASQRTFLREAAKRANEEWGSLGEVEKDRQRVALKASMLGDR